MAYKFAEPAIAYLDKHRATKDKVPKVIGLLPFYATLLRLKYWVVNGLRHHWPLSCNNWQLGVAVIVMDIEKITLNSPFSLVNEILKSCHSKSTKEPLLFNNGSFL